jgi:GNAT superfamily N-acetyltransferase
MDADDLRSQESWWSLYFSSFPDFERESRETMTNAVAGGLVMDFDLQLSGRCVGLGVASLFSDPAGIFLSYIAVDPAIRGQGDGSRMFRFIWETGVDRLRQRESYGASLLLEVECPELAESTMDRTIRNRRIDFFRRQGAALLELPYRQPAFDQSAAIPMRLMLFADPMPETVDRSRQRAFAAAIYRDRYHAVNGLAPDYLERLLRFY